MCCIALHSEISHIRILVQLHTYTHTNLDVLDSVSPWCKEKSAVGLVRMSLTRGICHAVLSLALSDGLDISNMKLQHPR